MVLAGAANPGVLQQFATYLAEFVWLASKFLPIYSRYLLNYYYFVTVSQVVWVYSDPSAICLSTAGCCIGVGFPWILCLHLSYLFLHYPYMCSGCPISPQVFFKSNFSICMCKFDVSLEDELRVFLCCCLESFSQNKEFLYGNKKMDQNFLW